MRERVDVPELRTAAREARRIGDALAEAVNEAEETQGSRLVVLGHIVAAEAALHATQEALGRLLRGPKEEVLAKVAELPARWDQMMAAFWRLQHTQRPWPTADGEFVEALGQVKGLIDQIREQLPVSEPAEPGVSEGEGAQPSP